MTSTTVKQTNGDVREKMNNYTSLFYVDVITYPYINGVAFSVIPY